MPKKDPKLIAQNIIDVIGAQNIAEVTNCQTRLRLNLKSNVAIDLDSLKKIDTVLGVITPSALELQVVLGPGWVSKVRIAFESIVNASGLEIESKTFAGDGAAIAVKNDGFKSAKDVAKEVKLNMRKKQNYFQQFFTKFSRIFAPMIIGFIGAGILAGAAGILQSAAGSYDETLKAFVIHSATAQSWYNILSMSLNAWKDAFIIIVGWRTAEVFGGSGVLGAIAAIVYVPSFSGYITSAFTGPHQDIFLGIVIPHNIHNWLIVGFRPALGTGAKEGIMTYSYASGNILGAMLAATATLWVEKGIRKFMPNAVDTILTPTIVIFLMVFANFFVIVPVSGYLYTAVAWFFEHLYNNPFGAFFLAAIFLITVTFGIHQGFVPIYQILIQDTHVNGLFPILAMAGFAQVGAVSLLYVKAEKDNLLRKQISGSLIPGVLGIGEPLIYGVTLPRIRPFITACIGAGFGGFFIGAVSMWGGYDIGLNSMFGPSGLPAAVLMTTPDGNIALAVVIYLIGCCVAVGFGFLITWFGYSSIVVNGSDSMKAIYKSKNISSKVWSTLLFVTVIGIFGYWFYKYFSASKEERKQFKSIKIV